MFINRINQKYKVNATGNIHALEWSDITIPLCGYKIHKAKLVTAKNNIQRIETMIHNQYPNNVGIINSTEVNIQGNSIFIKSSSLVIEKICEEIFGY